MSNWLETSYMARKGVGRGKAGKTHELTVEKQGDKWFVADIRGEGDRAEATIRFREVGTKHLSLAWAPLKKL